jgi:hypothetical protein
VAADEAAETVDWADGGTATGALGTLVAGAVGTCGAPSLGTTRDGDGNCGVDGLDVAPGAETLGTDTFPPFVAAPAVPPTADDGGAPAAMFAPPPAGCVVPPAGDAVFVGAGGVEVRLVRSGPDAFAPDFEPDATCTPPARELDGAPESATAFAVEAVSAGVLERA